MNQEDKIDLDLSIIIPVYNTQNYLEECLYSVINLKQVKYEVIIVNDGSTDNSKLISQNFQKKYPKLVRLYNQDNQGLSASRNFGISLARGRYIYFLDSDDYINNEELSSVVLKAKLNNLDLALFNGIAFYDDDYEGLKSYRISQSYQRTNLPDSPISGTKMLELQINRNAFEPSSCLYITNKKIFDEKKLYFIQNIIHEDNHLTPLLLLNSSKTQYFQKNILHRRIRHNSIMTNIENSREKSYKGTLLSLNDYLKSHKHHLINLGYRWAVINFYIKIMIHLNENELDYSQQSIKKIKLFKEFRIYQFPILMLKYIVLKFFPKISLKLRTIKNKYR